MTCLKRFCIAPIPLALIFLFTLNVFSQMVSLQHNSNLRKSSNTSSAIIELLSSGTKVTLLSKQRRSGYYHVQASDGAKGWVWARNVSVPVGNGTTTEKMLSAHVSGGQFSDRLGGFSPSID